MNVCKVDGCELEVAYESSGLCNKHYLRWRRHGDVHYIETTRGSSPEEIYRCILYKVKKDPITGCWNYYPSGSNKPKTGGVNFKGRQIGVHVFMWEYQNKKQRPDDMYICHTCDNPPCCNPEHLWLGTPQDNSDDMMVKKRSAKHNCENNGNSKITNAQAEEIYRLHWKYRYLSKISATRNVMSAKILALEYGVSEHCIANILIDFTFKGLKLRDKYAKYHSIPDIVKKCKVAGCLEKRRGWGYCKRHYASFCQYGDPLKAKKLKNPRRRKK